MATAIADNFRVSDWARYVFSPGTMLANKIVLGPTHTWHEMFEQLGHWSAIALITNMIFYWMLIFGSATIFFAPKHSK
jgi:hypothetical protein